MAHDSADHLLFGLLTLQNGLIDRTQLVDALRIWASDKSRSLSQHLVEMGRLTPDDAEAIQFLVARHLAKYGTLERSLASLDVGEATREMLVEVGDLDLDATLTHIPSPRGPSSHPGTDRTPSFVIGTATSESHRFRVLRPHARGGLGAVFVALDEELNREVALKQLLEDRADDPASRERFVLEAEITGGLEHPGIVPVYGLGAHADGRPYYAMRFIRGDNLEQAIDRYHGDTRPKRDAGTRSLRLRKLLRRFLDVCNAIDYAHSRGVLHRDIKPGNVIIGKYGETLVVDWGLAKAGGWSEVSSAADERRLELSSAASSSETLPGIALGTPAYMSPEQARGDLDAIGPLSDVYSLGATLSCLLTGKAPFEGEDVREVLRQVARGEFVAPRKSDPTIDKALEAICVKAMATRPEDRYTTCRLLADDIERWMADERVEAYREPWTRTLIRWLTRHRTPVTAAAAALLVGVIGLLGVLAVQSAANTRLQRSNEALAQANARERARFDLALQAIGTFHKGVSEDVLLRQKEFDELRTRLLRDAAKFYEKLQVELESHPDTSSRRALGVAFSELGQLTGKIGSKEEARQLHRRAVALRESLAANPGAGPDIKADLAHSLTAIAQIEKDLGQPAAVEALLDRARVVLEALVAAQPGEVSHNRDLAWNAHLLGALYDDTGRKSQAIAALERAAGLRLRLIEAHPDDLGVRADLAAGDNTLGWILIRVSGRSDDALRHFRSALAQREELVKRQPESTEARDNLARTLHRLAIQLRHLGRTDESLAMFERSQELRHQIVRANPTVSRFQSDLSSVAYDKAVALWVTGRSADAQAEIERSLEMEEAQVRANPGAMDFRRNLAISNIALGMILTEGGRPARALTSFERARVQLEELVHVDSALTEPRSLLAQTLIQLGWLFDELGQADQAVASLEGARKILDQLLEASPKDKQFADKRASALCALGAMHSKASRADLALSLLQRARADQEALITANPRDLDLRSTLAEIEGELVDAHARAGHHAEAIEYFTRSLTLWRELAEAAPKNVEYRTGRAGALLRGGKAQRGAGQSDEAVASFRQAIELFEALPSPRVQQRYDLARAHALLATAASIATPDLSRAEVERALDHLDSAIGAGYCNAFRLQTDPDLRVLRDRHEFQALMRDVAMPADVFTRE